VSQHLTPPPKHLVVAEQIRDTGERQGLVDGDGDALVGSPMSCVSVSRLSWFHWVPSVFFDKDACDLWGVEAPLALRSLLASAPCINMLLDVEAQIHCFHVNFTMVKCLVWSLGLADEGCSTELTLTPFYPGSHRMEDNRQAGLEIWPRQNE